MKSAKLAALLTSTQDLAAQIDWNLVLAILIDGLVLLAKASYLLGVVTRHGIHHLRRYIIVTMARARRQLRTASPHPLLEPFQPLLITAHQALQPVLQLLQDGWNYGLMTFDLVQPSTAPLDLEAQDLLLLFTPTTATSEQLQSLPVRELRLIATDLGLKGIRKCRKELLVQRLAAALSQ
jgi:hypothetical protein